MKYFKSLVLAGFFLFMTGCVQETATTLSTTGSTVTAASTTDALPEASLVYTFIESLQLPFGLVKSSPGGTVISLYDNALAAIIFTEYGDQTKAAKIFAFFEARLHTEFIQNQGGFSQFRDLSGNPVNARHWLGDNAWLLIALNVYEAKTGDLTFHDLQEELTTWIVSLQTLNGGISGGFDENGKLIPEVTEGEIDAYNAVLGQPVFHEKLLNYLKTTHYNPVKENLITGDPVYEEAIDLYSWGSLVFNVPLTYALDLLTTEGSVAGFCFDQDLDDIWLEGTGQMALAYIEKGDAVSSDYFLSQIQKTLTGGGIPYVTNVATGFGTGRLWAGADTNPCLSSSVWYLWALNDFNPFAFGTVYDGYF